MHFTQVIYNHQYEGVTSSVHPVVRLRDKAAVENLEKGLELELQQTIRREDGLYLLSFGGMEAENGHDTFVRRLLEDRTAAASA